MSGAYDDAYASTMGIRQLAGTAHVTTAVSCHFGIDVPCGPDEELERTDDEVGDCAKCRRVSHGHNPLLVGQQHATSISEYTPMTRAQVKLCTE